MKAAGISEWLLWFGWVTYSLMIYPICISVVTLILTTQFTSKPFYENVSPLLIWIVLMLYCVAVLIFLFAVGTLFSKRKLIYFTALLRKMQCIGLHAYMSVYTYWEYLSDWVAVIVSLITWFLSSSKWIISIVGDLDDDKNKLIGIPLLFMLPNLVLFNAFRTLEYFEFKGIV